MRPSSKCAMSMPVKAGGPFVSGIELAYRGQSAIWISLAKHPNGIGLHQPVIVDGFHNFSTPPK
jgi:hypothetical protein